MKIKVSKNYSLITLNVNCNYIIITLKFDIYVKTKKFSIKINLLITTNYSISKSFFTFKKTNHTSNYDL